MHGVVSGWPIDSDEDTAANIQQLNPESVGPPRQLQVVVWLDIETEFHAHGRLLVPLGKAFLARTPCPQLDCAGVLSHRHEEGRIVAIRGHNCTCSSSFRA